MKKNLFYLFALICSVSLFTACSDDDNEGGNGEGSSLPVEEINAVYTTSSTGNQLALTYSDAPMVGKSASFNSEDGKTATITLRGAEISLATRDAAPLELKNPGVVPGEEKTVLNVELKAAGETAYTFEGKDETNNRIIDYKGSVEKGKLILNLQVSMSSVLTGTWNLISYNPYGDVNPLHLAWESSKPFSISLFPGEDPYPLQPGGLLTLASAVPLIPAGDAKMNLNEAIAALLKDVEFRTDGNIVATYSDKANLTAPVWEKSPLNLVSYAVKNDRLYLYLNGDEILKMIMGGATRAFDPSTILPTVLPGLLQLIPMLSEGIPLGYTLNEETGALSVFVDQEVGMKLVNAILPLFENPDFIVYLKEQVTSNPDMTALAGMIESVLTQFPSVAQGTTKMELGLNLTKAVVE